MSTDRGSSRRHGPVRRAAAWLAAGAIVAVVASACDSGASSAARGGLAPSAADGAGSPPVAAPAGGGGRGGSNGPSGSAEPTPLDSALPSGSAPPAAREGVDPAKFGYATKGLRGEVFAFVTTDQLADAVDGLDWAATSTVVVFSLQAGANGDIAAGSTLRAWNSAAADRLIARAHRTGTKVVVSISRFSWSPSQTASSVELLDRAGARARLARDLADEVVRRGVDGVNVDFEPIPSGQQAHFTDLIRRIRTELDARRPGYQLTFDVVGHFESYDVGAALEPGGADAVYLMGYHYAGSFSTIAHATAPLDGPRYSVGDAIAGLRKVARPEQIAVGVPYYGHLWPTVSGAQNARTTGDGGDVPYHSARLIAREHPPTYDPAEAVQWSAWRVRDCATCALHWVQLYFDDARSLGAKWAEFQRQELLGTGFWTFGFQGDSGDLAGALRKAWLVSGG